MLLSFVYPPQGKKKSLPHRRWKKPNRSTGKHYPSRKAKSFSVIQPRGEVQQKQVQFQNKLLISSEAKKKFLKNTKKKPTKNNQDQETKTKYTFKSPAKFLHECVLNTSLLSCVAAKPTESQDLELIGMSSRVCVLMGSQSTWRSIWGFFKKCKSKKEKPGSRKEF